MCTYLSGYVRCESIWISVFFLNGSLGFHGYTANSILELIVNVCRDCVISTDYAVSFINSLL